MRKERRFNPYTNEYEIVFVNDPPGMQPQAPEAGQQAGQPQMPEQPQIQSAQPARQQTQQTPPQQTPPQPAQGYVPPQGPGINAGPQPAPYQNYAPQGAGIGNGESGLLQEVRRQPAFLWWMSLILGVLYAFCMYRNPYGITFPVLILGIVVCCVIFLFRYKGSVRKGTWFYFGAALLLGISSCRTMSFFLHAFNITGIILLMFTAMIREFYEDKSWGLFGYIGRICMAFGTQFACLGKPFSHLKDAQKRRQEQARAEGKKRGGGIPVLIGILIALAILVVVLPLLISSDPIMLRFVKRIWEAFDFAEVMLVVLMVVLGFFASYTFYCSVISGNLPKASPGARKNYNPVVAITFTSVLTAVYVLYSLIQIIYLFGQKNIRGMSYAQYARTGFFELLVVSVINVVLVLLVGYLFRDNKVLKIMLGVFCACTFVIIGSAAFRMMKYVDAYQLSFLRVLVLWFLLMLALCMIGITVYVFRRRFPVFKYCLAVVTVMYLCLSFARPDYVVARYNVDHTKIMSAHNVKYLCSLSVDAAPAIADLTKDQLEELENDDEGYFFRHYFGDEDYYANDEINKVRIVRSYFKDVNEKFGDMTWRTFNYSRARAASYWKNKNWKAE